MSRLKMAVVGVGHLGQHHARILAGMEDVELVGVVDQNPMQARYISDRLGCRAFDDLESLLHCVDAVSVVTPTVHHHRVASQFLRAGIPVIVEKPICRTLAEADELIRLADAAGVPLQVGHIERFNPAFEELTRCPIRPAFVEAERHGPYTGRSVDIGAVLDLMIHDLDLLLALVRSPVRSVSAVGAAVFGGHEDVANARIEFENGCVAHVTASRIAPHPKRRLRVWAAEGYAGIDFVTRKLVLVQTSPEVRQHGLQVERMTWQERQRLKDELFGRHLQVLNHTGDRKNDQLTSELRHFVDCVRAGGQPRVDGRDGRAALALAEQVLESMRNHQWEGRPDGAIGLKMPNPQGWLFQAPLSEAA